jgi:adenosylmethionine-8-amino-7-oxononanoate aminotransferase
VALESLRILDDERCLERVAVLERLFADRLGQIRQHARVADARGIGAVAAVELKSADGGGYLDTVGPLLYHETLAKDVLLRPLGNVLYVMPPYCITDADAQRVFDVIEEVLFKLGEPGPRK